MMMRYATILALLHLPLHALKLNMVMQTPTSTDASDSLTKCGKEFKFKEISKSSAKVRDCKMLPDLEATAESQIWIKPKTKDEQAFKTKRSYEITKEDTWKAWHHSYNQNDFRLQKAMDKLMNGDETKKFRIVFLGGSITYGDRGCLNDRTYVKALTRVLKSTYGDRVEVENLAEPATTGGHVISLFGTSKYKAPLEAADLVIMEYQYNELFARDNLEKQHDKLGLMLLNLPQKPAVLYFDLAGAPKVYKKWKQWDEFPPVEKSLHFVSAKRFEIPIVWFADIERQMNFSVNWLNPTHPDCPAHDAFTKTIHDVMQQSMMQVCEHGVRGEDTPLPDMSNSVWSHCAGFGKLQAHATLGEKSFPVKSAGEWVFQEDVPGKPGWIASKGSQKEIIFTNLAMKYGGLTLEYMRTYENAGSVTCALEKAGTEVKSVTLNGLWEKCVSLETTSQFFDIPYGNYDLRCKSDGGRFKLLGVQTC